MATARGGKLTNVETFTGTSATGSDGATNRVLTLANTPGTILNIIVQGASLMRTLDYTISSNEITFLNALWNDNNIEVVYAV